MEVVPACILRMRNSKPVSHYSSSFSVSVLNTYLDDSDEFESIGINNDQTYHEADHILSCIFLILAYLSLDLWLI